MRVLLDACIDPRLASLFQEFQCETAAQRQWQHLRDHELLLKMQGTFDVLVTIDRGFEFQHNLKTLRFGIVIVHVARNKVEFYRPLAGDLGRAIIAVQPGEVVHVPATANPTAQVR